MAEVKKPVVCIVGTGGTTLPRTGSGAPYRLDRATAGGVQVGCRPKRALRSPRWRQDGRRPFRGLDRHGKLTRTLLCHRRLRRRLSGVLARGVFRHPAVDVDGNRAMRAAHLTPQW